jgi:hypothetical protein
MDLTYNTQRDKINLSEYGRGVQELIEHLKTIVDLEQRDRMARTIFQVMVNLNPSVKELDNYEQKLWDHIHIMGNYELNLSSPYPKPEPEALAARPNRIEYKGALTRYRFYGRNLLEMIEGAKELPESELKTSYINYIASFMVNSSNSWNDENLGAEQVAQHLSDLSGGAIQLSPEQLNIHVEKIHKRPSNGNKGNNKKKKKPYRRR